MTVGTTLRPNLPHAPGVYLMRDNKGEIVYIGKARDLKKRVASYFLKPSVGSSQASKVEALMSVVRHIDYLPTASEREALVLERKLINAYKPDFNVMWKDDKSYPFIALTMREDYPRLLLTRQKKRDGSIYFGPYPNVSSVRGLLKWVWKKRFFPLRPCHLDIREGQPWPYPKVKSCLYLHTGECSAPCLGRIGSAEYKQMARRAIWFFNGRKDRMIRMWETEMKRFSRRMKFEEAAQVRNRIETVRHMDEHVTFRQMDEQTLELRLEKSRAVQDLMRVLDLREPPEVIECFDISHFQGAEKVASMVRFKHGRPDKSNYRKFIIRTVEGIDDFRAMAEVVGRRYRRLENEKRTFPNLVVIDGGKGQLRAALTAIQNEKLTGINVVALAKEEEEIYRPGFAAPLRLAMDSPALLLLRHIRDEAHRFAIHFHRQRRRRRMFYEE